MHIKSTQASVVAWATFDSTFWVNPIIGTSNNPPPAPKNPFIKPDAKPMPISRAIFKTFLFNSFFT